VRTVGLRSRGTFSTISANFSVIRTRLSPKNLAISSSSVLGGNGDLQQMGSALDFLSW